MTFRHQPCLVNNIFSKDETPNKRFYFFKVRDNQCLSSRFVRAARANLVEVKVDRRDKQVVSLSIRNKQTSVSVNPTNLKQLQPEWTWKSETASVTIVMVKRTHVRVDIFVFLIPLTW